MPLAWNIRAKKHYSQ